MLRRRKHLKRERGRGRRRRKRRRDGNTLPEMKTGGVKEKGEVKGKPEKEMMSQAITRFWGWKKVPVRPTSGQHSERRPRSFTQTGILMQSRKSVLEWKKR